MIKMEEEFGKMLNCDDLKCNICKHYLSVPPIIYTASTGIICGRCKSHAYEKNSNPRIHYQKCYEQIAERMAFPCMYENFGCTEILDWKDVKTHEESCSNRITACIYKLEEFEESHEVKCNWEGPVDQLTKHAKESHYENFVNPPKLLLEEHLKSCFLFTKCFDIVILLMFLYDEGEDVYTCIVMSDKLRYKETPLEYQLRIYDEEGVSHSLPTAVLKNLCLKSKILQLIGSKLNLSKIRLAMKPSYIAIDFIKQKCLDVDNYNPETSIGLGNLSHNALLLKCANPDCVGKSLTIPVYLSYEKRNICANCLPKPNGNTSAENAVRNYAMEQLLYSSQYKCQNINCPHVSSGLNYELHQKICPFKMKNYVWQGCKWNGDDSWNISEKSYVLSNLNHRYSLTEACKEQRFFRFDEHVFGFERDFTFGVKNNSIHSRAKFKLVCLETIKFSYKYEIEITCVDSPHLKIAFQQLVEPQNLPTLYSEYKHNDLTLTNVLNKLFPLVDTSISKLSFSVNISRIEEQENSEESSEEE